MFRACFVYNQINMNQIEWDALEKDFYENMKVYFDELYESILKLRQNSKKYDDPYARSQLCIAFIAVDTFARFHEIFSGVRGDDLDKDNAKRFKKWISKFVLTEDNDVYKANKTKIRVNEDVVWKLRNSLLHFYSFPKSTDGTKLGFMFNIPDSLHTTVEVGMKQKGHRIKFIDLHHLIQAIFSGFPLFMMDLKKQIEESPEKYIESVKYAHGIVQHENMKTLMIDK